MAVTPIIVGRLHPPRLTAGLVLRERLLAQLDDAAQRKLTIISAPAGYGKTSLLADWYWRLNQRGDAVAWLSCDSGDLDATTILRYLVAAVRRFQSGFGETTHALLSSPGHVPLKIIVSTILNELATIDRWSCIILDDLHLITAPSATDLVREVILKSPDNLHFVVASRAAPDIPTGKLAARGELAQISANDLQFNDDEVRLCLDAAGFQSLSSDAVSTLNRKMEGWAAGIGLVRLMLAKSKDAEAFIDSFGEENRLVADFLTETVLSNLDEPTRDFLRSTSILGRLSAPLCDFILDRKDSQDILLQLERTNLFLFALDDQRKWYRYHHLFAAYFRQDLQRRDPARLHALARRAAQWFYEHGFALEAIEYAYAAMDHVYCAEILEEISNELVRNGQLSFLLSWTDRLPVELLRKHPVLRLHRAWAYTLQWRRREAEEIIREVENEWLARSVGEKTVEEIDRLLRHRKLILMTIYPDDISGLLKLARKLSTDPSHRDVFVRASIEAALLYARISVFDFKRWDNSYAAVDELLSNMSDRFGRVLLNAIELPGLLILGRLAAAESLARRSMDDAIAATSSTSPLVSVPAMHLAEVLYERGEAEEASCLIERHLRHAGEVGLMDHLTAGYITLARLLFSKKDFSGAEEAMRQCRRLSARRQATAVIDRIIAEEIRQRLILDDQEEVRRLAEEADLLGPARAFTPGELPTTVDWIRALSWARVKIACRRPAEALEVLKPWRRFLEKRACFGALLQTDILMAVCCQHMADPAAGRRYLRSALAIGSRNGYLRSFAEEGEPLRALIRSSIPIFKKTVPDIAIYAEKILSTLAVSLRDQDVYYEGSSSTSTDTTEISIHPSGSINVLSARQAEILRLMRDDLSNREIAEHLGLTEGTVKWHAQQIFDKLGVRRRVQAVRRATALGLLP